MTETISATSMIVTATARIEGPERLAGPVGDHLGVMHGRKDGGDEDDSRRGVDKAASADEGGRKQNDPRQ